MNKLKEGDDVKRIITTEKYMNNTISIRRFLDLDKNKITALNLLLIMMSGRSQKFPTRDSWSQAASHAYGTQAGWRIQGFGPKVLVDYKCSWLDESFITSDTYTGEVETLFIEGLENPVLTEENLAEAKYLLKNRLISAMQEPESAAVRAALSQAAVNHDITVPMNGRLEDIDEVTLEDVQSVFSEIQASKRVDLYIGNTGSALIPDSNISQELESFTCTAIPAQETKKYREERDIAQSALVQIYATGKHILNQGFDTLTVLNAMLGGSSVSMLFEVVREQYSLCYSISSTLIRFDGALCISTGCDISDLEQVKKLISECIVKIAQQDFDPKWFEIVKNECLDSLTGSFDTEAGQLDAIFRSIVLGREISLQERLDRISKVTMEDVAEAAKKLVLVSEAEVVQKNDDGIDEKFLLEIEDKKDFEEEREGTGE